MKNGAKNKKRNGSLSKVKDRHKTACHFNAKHNIQTKGVSDRVFQIQQQDSR